jgi:cation/acetate symporter
MSLAPSTRLVNPRLGTYFGILASAFFALSILVMLFEQLGISQATLSFVMLAMPILLCAAIGVASWNQEPIDFFAAGRRVPAFYSGLVLAITASGASGVVALTGAFFMIGFDVLCIAIGGLSGFVLMAVLMAPFFRKFGAFTLPSYLGRRFESRTVRMLSAAFLTVPLALLLAAELELGAGAASLLSGYSVYAMINMLAIALVVTITAGGVRSQTWSGVGHSIIVLLAIFIPVAIAGVYLTNLPLPQLSHGPILRSLTRDEGRLALPLIQQSVLAFDFPGEGLQNISKRFATPFGAIGSLAFVVITLTTMAAFVCAPWLLPRVAATPGVYETRKSIGWSTVIFGLLMITLASVGVFMREYVVEIIKDPSQQVPLWLSQLSALDLAGIDTESPRLNFKSMSFKRDAILPALPMATGLPSVALYVVLAGAIAAALAAAGATAIALANILAEDVFYGTSWEPAPTRPRLIAGRAAIVAAVGAAAAISHFAPTDPMRMWFWVMVLTASTLFPVLLLSVWWKRMTMFGAITGIASGFLSAVVAILSSEAGMFPLDSALAGLISIPASALSCVAVSLITPSPSKHQLEFVRDIRVPGGEIIYDREMRLERQKRLQRNQA